MTAKLNQAFGSHVLHRNFFLSISRRQIEMIGYIYNQDRDSIEVSPWAMKTHATLANKGLVTNKGFTLTEAGQIVAELLLTAGVEFEAARELEERKTTRPRKGRVSAIRKTA